MNRDALDDGLTRFAIVNVDVADSRLRFGRGGLVVVVEAVMMGLLEVAVQQP